MTKTYEQYRAAEARFWMSTLGALPAEQYQTLPGLDAHVRLLTYGRGPTLLFVHGGPNAAATWAPLIRLLPEFRCVLLDRPGCGLSSPAAKPIRTVRSYVTQLIADTLASLDTHPAAIVASSFGSYCVLAYALSHPTSVRRMVHMGCPALVPGSSIPLPFLLPLIPGLGALVRQLERPSLGTVQRAFRRMGHSDSIVRHNVNAEAMNWYTALMRETPTQANDQALFSRIRPRDKLTYTELSQLRIPTSFFWGEADTFGDARVARALAQQIPGAALELVEHGGHLPWLDMPDRAAAHIRSFTGI